MVFSERQMTNLGVRSNMRAVDDNGSLDARLYVFVYVIVIIKCQNPISLSFAHV
jgi:hypothetical protein